MCSGMRNSVRNGYRGAGKLDAKWMPFWGGWRESRAIYYADSAATVCKILAVLVVPLGGSATHTLTLLGLAAWALLGPRRAIEALSLSWLAISLNPGLYPIATIADVLRWLVVGAAFISVCVYTFMRGLIIPRAWIWMSVFVVVASVLSVVSSYAVDVSLFKLSSFFAAVTAVLLGFYHTRAEAARWMQWLFLMFALVVLVGLPLMGHPIGYFRNGRGFQGILNHPQTYAVFLGPLLAWHVARLLSREIRGSGMWVLAIAAGISLVATQSRTGVLAAGGGLVVAGVWWLLTNRARLKLRRSRAVVGLVVMCFATTVIVANMDDVAASTRRFVLKYEDVEDISDAFYRSRGLLVERSLEGLRRRPWTGIGFGLPSDSSTLEIRSEPVFGLPVGASVEKGFAFVGLLEEVGVIGFTLFVVAIVVLLRPTLSRHSSYPSAALAAGAVLANFGEAVMFSLGGSGLFVWLLIGVARVIAKRET